MAQWYILRNGKEHGPVNAQQLKELAATGKLLPSDMVRREDMTTGRPAREVKGLFPATPAAPKQTPQPPTTNKASVPVPEQPLEAKKPGWTVKHVAFAAAGLLGLLVLCSGVAGLFAKKSGPGHQAKAGANDRSGGTGPSSEQGSGPNSASAPLADSADLPDFSKVDYRYDFSKVDYDAIPQGARRHTQETTITEGAKNLIGKLKQQEGYIDASGKFVAHGVFITWADAAKSKKLREGKMLHGKSHGVLVEYYDSGAKSMEWPFVNDKRHGICRLWHKNGQLEVEEPFFEGNRHGIAKGWYENGKQGFETTWVSGKKHGLHKEWNADGTPKRVFNYRNGDPHGLCIVYAKDGQGNVYEATRGRFENYRLVGKARFGYQSASGQVYYIEATDGPWRGGRIEEFIAKMHYGIEGTGYGGQFLPRQKVATCEVPSQEAFFEVFGRPAQDQPHPDVFGQPRHIQQLVRRWVYQCSDGPLVLKAQISNASGKVVVTTRPDYR